MAPERSANLRWLDLLAVRVPGYAGYQARPDRSVTDRILREAIARDLAGARTRLEQFKKYFVEHEQPSATEINAIDRVERHLDRIVARLGLPSAEINAPGTAETLSASNADPLHAIDLALLDRADHLVARFKLPDHDHDFLAHIEEDLRGIEAKLDERDSLLQGIR